MTQTTQPTRSIPLVSAGCFLCGKPIYNPAEKWTWVGATGQAIQLHTGCIYCCAAALRLDAYELAQQADAGGRFN